MTPPGGRTSFKSAFIEAWVSHPDSRPDAAVGREGVGESPCCVRMRARPWVTLKMGGHAPSAAVPADMLRRGGLAAADACVCTALGPI